MFGIPGPQALNAHNTPSVIVTTEMHPPFPNPCREGDTRSLRGPLELNDPFKLEVLWILSPGLSGEPNVINDVEVHCKL